MWFNVKLSNYKKNGSWTNVKLFWSNVGFMLNYMWFSPEFYVQEWMKTYEWTTFWSDRKILGSNQTGSKKILVLV